MPLPQFGAMDPWSGVTVAALSRQLNSPTVTRASKLLREANAQAGAAEPLLRADMITPVSETCWRPKLWPSSWATTIALAMFARDRIMSVLNAIISVLAPHMLVDCTGK